jgi:amino acid permease
MSITLLSSWEGVATSFQLGLQNGGPVALVWGMILSASGTLCLALSLAEMASICPISGAQYHVRFSPKAFGGDDGTMWYLGGGERPGDGRPHTDHR